VRRFQYRLIVECGSEGVANETRLEELLDLSVKDLVMDDEFIDALDEKVSVSIQIFRENG
jgi:hypothetical protein